MWSKHEGYPGDPRYRDFYRDIGFDLDFDYVKSHLPSPENRGFTGMKYYRITGGTGRKEIYQRDYALQAASEHAAHFLGERVNQIRKLEGILDRPPIIIAPTMPNSSATGGMKVRNSSTSSPAKLSTNKNPWA